MANKKLKTKISCCEGCENRSYNCHSICPEYKEEKQSYNNYRDALRKEKFNDNLHLTDYHMKARNKIRDKNSKKR